MAAQRRDSLRLQAGASADTVAQALRVELDGFGHALQPIIGVRGVAAMVVRSLHLSAERHPWLAPSCTDIGTEPDLALLQGLLQQQDDTEALAAAQHCLQALRQLLVKLIGQPLTFQLLPQRVPHPLDDRPAESPPP